MRNFVQDMASYGGCLLRQSCWLVLITCFSSGLISESEASVSEPSTSPWVVCEVAPRIVVLTFVIASLLFLAKFIFGFITSWWANSRRRLVGGRGTPASFWLPSSLLLGGVVGIFFGSIAALIAPAFPRLDEKSLQAFLPEVAMFALSGALFLAALMQFASEVYFAWRPHREGLRLLPYKHKVDEIFHRIGVSAGVVLTLLGLIAAVTLMATSTKYEELSVWESLNILIYISIFSVAAGIVIYWILMLVGWLLKGDPVILLLIIIFVLFYWFNLLWRFLTSWGGSSSGAHSDETRSVPSVIANWHSVQNVATEDSDKLQEYCDRKFLWLPVFFIVSGMLLLLKWPPVGTGMLVAAAISMLYYLAYYQNFIFLPVLFIIIGLVLVLVLPWPLVGTVLLAAAAISILYAMTSRVAL